jgi:hypothetical protein
MDSSRGLTINFTDGTKVSYNFPEQGTNSAAKQLRLEELFKHPFVVVLADGILTLFTVANITSIQMPITERESDDVRLPSHVIRNATLARGSL